MIDHEEDPPAMLHALDEHAVKVQKRLGVECANPPRRLACEDEAKGADAGLSTHTGTVPGGG